MSANARPQGAFKVRVGKLGHVLSRESASNGLGILFSVFAKFLFAHDVSPFCCGTALTALHHESYPNVKPYCAWGLAFGKEKAYKGRMTDMSEIPGLVKKARVKRDAAVRKLLAAGKGPSAIGRELGITRQRAQQIIKRLANGKD